MVSKIIEWTKWVVLIHLGLLSCFSPTVKYVSYFKYY